MRLVVLRHLLDSTGASRDGLAMRHPKPDALTMSSVSSGVASQHQGRITAVLGPTNTGKTHLAIERMLGHQSGMIGFPLRLLARENYDRIVAPRARAPWRWSPARRRSSRRARAISSARSRSMPLDRPVAFLAVDEIQLCADPERGHVFTDRLLHARGMDETMFLGAETIRPLLRRLVPEAEFISRPRFSTLTYAGPKKLTRLPPRSAVVAFSADRCLRHRRADPPPARRGGGGAGRAQPAHPQRPGGAVPGAARSTIWSPPTPSAWASTWTSTMSPSPS